MTYTSKVTKKGQITLPLKLRENLRVETGQKVEISLEDNAFVVKPVPSLTELEGSLKTKKKVSLDEMEKTFGNSISENYKSKK